MLPWLSYSAGDLHFPFSGSVAQDISPAAEWFFGAIRPEAGDGQVEKEIFEVASYGRQLGLITEVLLALVGEHPVQGEAAQKSLERLRCYNEKIQKIKEANRDRTAEAATLLLEKLRASDPDAFQRVLRTFGH